MFGYIRNLISSILFQIYTIIPLSRIGWFFLGGLIIWTLLGAAALYTEKETLWRRGNGVIAVLFTLLLLYMTVVSRSETSQGGVMLRPFYSFYLAREVNREYYRTMQMNVLLFFPLGLTLPFALSARKHPVLKSLLIGALLSMCIETMQYVFSLGWAEIDDVIMNTLGVLFGSAAFGLVWLLNRYWLSRDKN